MLQYVPEYESELIEKGQKRRLQFVDIIEEKNVYT